MTITSISPWKRRLILESVNILGMGLPVNQDEVAAFVSKRSEGQLTQESVRRYMRFLLEEGTLRHPIDDVHRVHTWNKVDGKMATLEMFL